MNPENRVSRDFRPSLPLPTPLTSAFRPAGPPGPPNCVEPRTVESDATGPNNALWSPSTAMSAMHSPPSAMLTARSASTRPGSWTARGRRKPASACDRSPVNELRSARSASSRDPACDTTPAPSAETTTLGRAPVLCTRKVPLVRRIRTLDKPYPPSTEALSVYTGRINTPSS